MKVKEILETMDYGKAPEDPKPSKWIEKNGAKFGLYINGESNIPQGRESFETRNPATGEILATICQAQVDDVDRAMQSARAAQADWEEVVVLPGKISLCDRSSRAKTFAPLRGHRNIGQWKTDSESRDIDIPLVAGISIFMPVPLS